MDIFNTLAFITKPDHVELPAEATLEAIETLTELDYCPVSGDCMGLPGRLGRFGFSRHRENRNRLLPKFSVKYGHKSECRVVS